MNEPGAIILARHGEPALSRETRLSAAGYGAWWAQYEEGGILAGQLVPEDLKAVARFAGAVIASTRRRSIESVLALGVAPPFEENPLFIEAPLPPPPFPEWIRLSPRHWGVIARFWWWVFDYHPGVESRTQAERRADEAAKVLIARAAGGADVLLVAHGFFNTMIGRALRRRGWRCTLDQGFRYWSIRRFEAALPSTSSPIFPKVSR